MTDTATSQEIKDLLLGLTQQVVTLSSHISTLAQETSTLNTRFGRLEEHYYALDKKLDTPFAALDKKIDIGLGALDKKIETQYAALDKKTDVVHKEVKGEMGRLSDKVDGLTKHVDNQETLSRGATLALIAGIITAAVRFIAFPINTPS